MTKDELLDLLLTTLKNNDQVDSASRIPNEPTIGVDLLDGSEYFIEVQDV